MEAWAAIPTELLWRNALVAMPMAATVAVIARWLPCRPATRHMLWVSVLAWMVAMPWLPAAPSALKPGAWVAALPDPTGPTDAKPQPMESAAGAAAHEQGTPFAMWAPRSDDRLFENSERQGSVARLRPRGGPKTPRELAQASGPNEPPTLLFRMPTDRLEAALLPPPGSLPNDGGVADVSAGDEFGWCAAEPCDASGGVAPLANLTPWQVQGILANSRIDPGDLGGVVRRSEPRTEAIELVGPGAASQTWTGFRHWAAGLAAVVSAALAVPPIPIEVWVGGALLLALLAAVRVLLFFHLIRQALPASKDVRHTVRLAAIGLGLNRVPETYMVDQPVSPMVWCGRRVRLILPSSLWLELDERGRRAVVYHELAHVRRKDHWVSWLEAVVGIAYWWYPLVWWVRNRMRSEAEDCCDAWVTTLLPRDRRVYAEALLRANQFIREQPRRMPAMVMGATTGRADRFARRLKMVMTESVKPRPTVPGIALVLLIAALGWVATPAHSCPSKEKEAKVSAPSLCPKCKDGRPCASCAEKCAREAAMGVASTPCAKCKPGERCEHCAKTADESLRAMSTFHEYLAGREGERHPRRAPVAHAVGVGRSEGGDESAAEIDAQMRRLERQLNELGERLERLHQPTPGRAPRPGHPGAPGEPGQPGCPGEPGHPSHPAIALRAPHPPGAAAAPTPPCAPEPTPAPEAGAPMPAMPPMPPMPRVHAGAIPRVAMAPRVPVELPPLILGAPEEDGGGIVVKVHRLPDGKRQALTELMARSDVPVRIRSVPDGIEVHATSGQHRVFGAFVRLIDPDGDHGPEVAPPPGRRPPTPGPRAEQPRKRSHEMAEAKAAKRAQREAERALREAMRREHARARTQQREVAREVREQQLRAMEEAVNAMRERADKIREAADKLREKSEKLREKAQNLREKADTNSESAEPMRAEAESLDEAARNLDERAINVEEQAAQFDNQVQELDEEVQQMALQIEERFQFDEEEEAAGEESEDDSDDEGDADDDSDEDLDAADDGNDESDDEGNEDESGSNGGDEMERLEGSNEAQNSHGSDERVHTNEGGAGGEA